MQLFSITSFSQLHSLLNLQNITCANTIIRHTLDQLKLAHQRQRPWRPLRLLSPIPNEPRSAAGRAKAVPGEIAKSGAAAHCALCAARLTVPLLPPAPLQPDARTSRPPAILLPQVLPPLLFLQFSFQKCSCVPRCLQCACVVV